jgi:hypothetical protein
MGGEEIRLAAEDGVEAAVTGLPGKQTFDHPPDSNGEKLAVAGFAGRDMNVMVESGLGEGHAFVAAVALEPQFRQPGQHRCGAGTVGVSRCQLKIEQRAMLVADGAQLEAFDQLAAIDAAQVGAERSELSPDSCPLADSERGLSTTAAEGRISSPHATRQSNARRCPSRRHRPKRVQRANALCSVVKGMPDRKPAMRHCMPPKVSIQIRPSTRRRRSVSGLRPCR